MIVTSFAGRHWNRFPTQECVASLDYWPMKKIIYVDGGVPPELKAIDMDRIPVLREFKSDFAEMVRERTWGTGEYDYRFDAVRFFHKVLALKMASEMKPDVLVWLDADVVTHKPIPAGFFDIKEDVACLSREKWGPECGFVIYNMEKAGWRFIDELFNIYYTGEFASFPEWHDSYLFGEILHDYNWKNLCPGAKTKHCWQESPLQEYMTHYKGGARKALRKDFSQAELPQDRFITSEIDL